MKRYYLFGLGGMALALALMACSPAAPEPPSGTPATNAVAPAKPKPEFERLQGRWERPDGGYVLELRSVDAEGKFDAGYFNPSPINVERALAYSEEGKIKVFVLLRDANYPGCTYKLEYDSKTDQLFGQYYQAAMQETYDVAFARLK